MQELFGGDPGISPLRENPGVTKFFSILPLELESGTGFRYSFPVNLIAPQ